MTLPNLCPFSRRIPDSLNMKKEQINYPKFLCKIVVEICESGFFKHPYVLRTYPPILVNSHITLMSYNE